MKLDKSYIKHLSYNYISSSIYTPIDQEVFEQLFDEYYECFWDDYTTDQAGIPEFLADILLDYENITAKYDTGCGYDYFKI